MPTPLVDYYRELQICEGLTPTELIAEWDNTAVNEISADFSAAMTNSQMTQQVVPIRPGSSNQSVGNQVADFFTLQFPAFLAKHVIPACSDAGYPDKILQSLPKYITPTSRRPNVSLTQPHFIIERVLVSCAFGSQQRGNNSRVAPYSNFLGAFLHLLVLVDRPLFSSFFDQVSFRQRSTAVCYQNKVIA
jgi:hypothetical protein